MKKNFRKIPKKLSAKLALSTDKNDFVAAVVLHIPKQDINEGKWKKVGIAVENGKYVISECLPPVQSGKFSATNKLGKVVVRRDLPMVSKTYSFEAPDYGDWSNGSHLVSWEKDIYRREKIAPKNLTIVPNILRETDDSLVVSF